MPSGSERSTIAIPIAALFHVELLFPAIDLHVPVVMAANPASREDIVKLVGDVDASYIERILRTHATMEEIKTALGDLRGRSAQPPAPPSGRAATVRGILEDLFHETPRRPG